MEVVGKSDFQEFYFSITGLGKDENKANAEENSTLVCLTLR